MEFGVGLESVGEFELNTCWLVDGSLNVKFVIDGWRQKDKVTFIYPLASIICTYLEQCLHVLRFVR